MYIYTVFSFGPVSTSALPPRLQYAYLCDVVTKMIDVVTSSAHLLCLNNYFLADNPDACTMYIHVHVYAVYHSCCVLLTLILIYMYPKSIIVMYLVSGTHMHHSEPLSICINIMKMSDWQCLL